MADHDRQTARRKAKDRAVNLDRAQAIRDDLGKQEQQKKEAAVLAEEERKHRLVAENAAALKAAMRKVFVCGDSRGQLERLFSTVEAQTAKVGAFDLLLAVGSFLPEDGSDVAGLRPYLAGEKGAPLATYLVDAGSALLQAFPDGKKLCDNVYFLGGYGVCDVKGLRVAYLSGHYNAAVYDTVDADFVGGAFTARAVSQLRDAVLGDSKQRGVDVLLTCAWPQGLEQKLLDAAALPADLLDGRPWRESCSAPIAELCLAIEPRYHIFGTADLFYARPPFQAPKRGHVCRLLGMGCVGSASKQRKWLHALSLGPMALMKREDLKQLPGNVTPCPFSAASRKRSAVALSEPDAKRAAVDAESAARNAGEALSALKAGDVEKYRSVTTELENTKLYIPAKFQPEPEAPAELPRGEVASNKTADSQRAAAGGAGTAPTAAATTPTSAVAGAAGTGATKPTTAVEEPSGEELSGDALIRKERSVEFLGKPPEPGSVRYTFSNIGALGLRLSRDVPPWILEVRDGSLAAKKAPKVPLGGVVLAVNGYELIDKDNADAIKGLSQRPVILDIKWPEDQGKPTVNRA